MFKLNLRVLFLFALVGFILIGKTTAQSIQTNTSEPLKIAQSYYNKYLAQAADFKMQLAKLDSLYAVENRNYQSNLNLYKKAKSAFKSLKLNYKSELAPHEKLSKSQNKKQATDARKSIEMIKTRFRANGVQAAEAANQASREMVRTERSMQKTSDKQKQIIAQENATLIELKKWEQILKKLKVDEHFSDQKNRLLK
ncbi:MAG TPA: hypothetical protein DCG69_04235 [Bacteroidales bacterium]|nr:hypothetical protein [Bacteroidales bacterium]